MRVLKIKAMIMNKWLILSLAFGLIGLFLPQQGIAEDINSKIEVTITNIDKSKGGNLIIYVLRDDKTGLNDDNIIARRIFKAHRTTQQVIFSANDLPEELTFKVLHDEDENGRMTSNWTGIWPGEGLAFSNGQTQGVLGAPSFDESKLYREQYLAGVSLALDYP